MTRYIVCLLLLSQQLVNGADYYWVGGSGNWSDITHWATSSGGNVQHDVVPSAGDDVYFDGGSFDQPGGVVTVDNDNVFCGTMDWTGVRFNPTIRGARDKALNVTRSVNLDPAMVWEFMGPVRLSGDDTGSLDFANNRIKTLSINGGSASNWTLESNLLVDSTYEIFGGGFNSGGHEIRAESFLVWATSPTILVFESSQIRLSGTVLPTEQDDRRNLPILGIQTENLTLEAGTSKFIFSSRFASMRVAGNEEIRFYDVEFASPTGLSTINYTRYGYENFFDWIPPINSFHRIHFRGNGLIFGSHRTEILELDPGNQYRFESNRMVAVDRLIAEGTCDAPIGLSTIAARGPFEINSDQDQDVTYVSIRSCIGAGAGNFRAANSADLGGNEGWDISEKAGTDLYWVGGRGNWNDPQHWSTSSGGPSGACVPFPTDNVFFDENSFMGSDTVHLNTDFALCADMTWSNLNTSPILWGPSNHALNIYGSLTFHPNLEQAFAGDINFLSAKPGNVVDLAGKKLLRHTTFDGTGSWSLASPFEVSFYMYFLQGSFDSQSQPMILEGLYSEVESDRQMRLGSSRVLFRTLRFYNHAPVRFETNNLSLDAGTSLLDFSISAGLYCSGDENERLRWHHIHMGGGYVNGNRAQMSSALMRCADETYFGGKIQWDRLVLNEGHAYVFENWNDYLLEVDTLEALGSCRGTIGISSRHPGRTTQLVSNWDQQTSHLELRDVHIVGATFTAEASIDYGNTSGWIIDEATGRDLYWVGGTGAWEDPLHWSATSGGTGGECIPTSIDNVFFDANSFSDGDQYVETLTYATAVCHNFTWDGPPTSIRFYRREVDEYCCIADFYIYGSLDIRTLFVPHFYHIEFRGDDREEYIIRTSGLLINGFSFNNTGHRTLVDEWNTMWLTFEEGSFKANNQAISARQMYISSQEEGVNIDLDSSEISLNHQGNEFWAALHLDSDHNLEFDGDQSTILIDNGQDSHVRWFGNHIIHRLVFGSEVGRGHLLRGGYDGKELTEVPIRILEFKGDGIIYGDHQIDSLLFANGHAYVLESEKIQRVSDHIRIRGNNCIQLSLRSTESGNPSIMEMTDGEVNGDFIQIQDQLARGGATFFAGANSADVSNNQGWIFDSKEEFVDFGLLGNDRIFCSGETSLTLNEGDIIGAQTYLWSDGSIESEFLASGPGQYFVDVSYATGCVLSDTINLLEPDEFQVDLGQDQLLCQGEMLDINADLNLAGAIYRWEDGSTGAERSVDSSGLYVLEVELNGCTTSDSLILDYVLVPDFAVALPPTLCLGDTILLEVPLTNVVAEWSTGEMSNQLEVTRSGEYIATVSISGCSDSDSISLDFVEPEVFDLGPDTLLCAGEELPVSVTAVHGDSQFAWDDGLTDLDRVFAEEGVYRLSSNRMGCVYTDSIEITSLAIDLDLSVSNDLCEGDTLNLDVQAPNRSVLWSTGSANAQISLTSSGSYWVALSERHCNVVDSFTLDFVEPPGLDLPDSLIMCARDQVTIGMEIPDASFSWSHGETDAVITVSPVQDSWYRLAAYFGVCTATDSILVKVNTLPEVVIEAPAQVCPSDSFQVSVTSNADEIFWIDGSQAYTRQFYSPQTLDFSLDLAGCTLDTSLTVEAFATDFTSLAPDTLICDDETLLVDASIIGGTYLWNDGLTQGERTIAEEGTYIVQVDDGNCDLIDSITVSMRECVYFQAYAPNAFSPNGDGSNDVFRIEFDPRVLVGDYLLQVFDRWGNLVFESMDPNLHWDGRAGSSILPPQVYLWHIAMQYQDDDGVNTFEDAGDVLIVR